MTENETLREMLTERGVDWKAFDRFEQTTQWSTYNGAFVYWSRERDGKLLVETTAPTKCSASCTPAQAIAATVGKGKAKAHPWGYESDTGFFDMTRCECGETNDISARYCNQCGREIQLDMSVIEYAEDYTPQCTCKVNADGTLTSLRDGKIYVDAAMVGGTCRLVDNESGPNMHCTVCGREVDDEYRYFMERWGYSRCPHCGRRIEVDE